MVEILKPDFLHEDERGKLVQLVHDGYRQINVITSKAGGIRGGHYHKNNREAFYVVKGACEVIFTRDGRKESHGFQAGDFFEIEPGTGHTFRYLEDTVLIGLYDLGVEEKNGKKDIYPIEE